MDMKTVVLKTVSENSKDGKTWGMWFLQYFVDGKSTSIKVVTGEKKVKDDQSILYVAKGFSVKDFAALKPHYPEFAKLSANPPAFPASDAAAPAEPELEDVPF